MIRSTASQPWWGLIVAASLLLLMGVPTLSGGASVVAQSPPPEDGLLRELAERAIAAPYPFGPGPEPLPAIQLLPGQMPSDLPVAVPTPAGARLIGSIVRTVPPTPAGPTSQPMGPTVPGTTVLLDVPGSREAVLALYEQALAQQGWSPAQGGAPFPTGGGFQTAIGGGSLTFCGSEGGPWVSVTAYPRPNGINDVRLAINQGGGPCSIPTGPVPPRAASRAAELLPRLVPPPGVLLQASGGGGGGPNRWSSEATTETTRGAAELEGHFAEQMAAAGWVRQAGRPDGQLAWSRWAIPAEGDWQALLLLAEWPAPGRQWLSVRVESPTLPSWGGAGGVSYFGPAPAPVPPGASAPSPAAPPLPTSMSLPVQAP